MAVELLQVREHSERQLIAVPDWPGLGTAPSHNLSCV